MTVSFNEIPGNIRVPLWYAELNAGGTPFASSNKLLLIGQMLTAGSASLDEPVLVSGNNAEDGLFGTGSMLSEMFKIARLNAPFQEIWALPVTDDIAGVEATATLDYTGATLPVASATNATVYIAGREYNVVVSTTDTAITIGAAMTTEINDDPRAAVVAVDNLDGTITLTARHPGESGNDIDIRSELYGDESALAKEVVVTAMAGGLTNPDITLGVANLGDEEFTWIVSPYTDLANMGILEGLLDNSTGRWSPFKQLYGAAMTAMSDTVANLSTFGSNFNSPHVSVMGTYGSPTPPWLWAAAVGAKVAKHLSDAPELSRPLQFITLADVIAPKISDRFTIVDRNILYYDGIGSYNVSDDGAVRIDRVLTTYRLNQVGFADATFLDIQTLAQAQYILRYLRTKVTNVHGRNALANDSAPPIQNVSRPRDIRNTLIIGYAELAALAVVEEQEVFESNIVVERNATDANRVDVYLPLDHVNQLRVIAVNATSFLQFPAEISG